MPKDSPELLTVFSQALRNFQQHDQNRAPQLDDFPTMLVRFWPHLPPATALATVDAVLQESRDDDDKGALRVSFSTLKGSVAFNSAYRLRLFKMLPILEVLDKDRAESLLQENTETQAALTRYPQGLQSLDPGQHQDTLEALRNLSNRAANGWTVLLCAGLPHREARAVVRGCGCGIQDRDHYTAAVDGRVAFAAEKD
jgi:hypothetical protein